MAEIVARAEIRFAPGRVMALLSDEVASMLLAENLPPSTRHVIRQVDSFVQMVDLSRKDRPFLRRQPHALALHFDLYAIQSEMLLDAPDDLIVGYTQTMMGFLLFNPAPRSIGMIGLGGGSLAKFCYRYLPSADIAVAEIDPEVIALRDEFRIPQDDQRLQVRCVDGADFVRQFADRFDVLLVDGFDRKGQPPQLCSQRFYDDCYRALAPDGILVTNLLGDDPDVGLYLGRLHTAFDGSLTVIDALDSMNKIVFACRGDIESMGESTLNRRLSALRDDFPVVLDLTARSLLLARRETALVLPLQS
ncbi:MAG TPA: fused MFS/spermidine synthase [Pseudoduganella sp.]